MTVDARLSEILGRRGPAQGRIGNVRLTREGGGVLSTMVRDCVGANRPVNSGTLVGRAKLRISSTAIQGSLTSLAGRNCLIRPRASTKQVPALRNCECCVSGLVGVAPMARNKQRCIRSRLCGDTSSPRDVLGRTDNIVSELANYATMAAAPSNRRDEVREVEFIRANSRATVTIIVTSGKVVGAGLFHYSFLLGPRLLAIFSGTFGRVFSKVGLSSIGQPFVRATTTELNRLSVFAPKILITVVRTYRATGRIDICLDNIAGPLFVSSIGFLGTQGIVRFLGGERSLTRVLRGLPLSASIDVNNRGDEARLTKDTMVSAQCQLSNGPSNILTIVSPIEASCTETVSVLRYISRDIDALVSRLVRV